MHPNPIRPLLPLALLALPFAARAEGPTVTSFVACADVAEKACVGEAQRFGLEVGTVWAYAVIDNRGEPLPLEMVWRRDGEVIFTAELTVGRSRRWRTWSRKRLRSFDRGGWTVALRRADAPHDPPLAVIALAVGDGPVPEAAVEAPTVEPHEAAEDQPDPPALPASPAPPAEPPAPAEEPATGDAPSAPLEPAAPPATPPPTPAEPVAPPAAPDPPPNSPAEPPARPEAPDPPPTTPAPAPASPPAPTPPPAAPAAVTSTAPAADTVCRGWVNLRRDGADGPIYQTLDLRIGPRTVAEAAPGLLVAGPEELFALAVVTRHVQEKGPGGVADRSWDMLFGRGLETGSRRVWAGFPATMAPPEKGEPPRFEQRHPLMVHSVVGPYVGVEATLDRTGRDGTRRRARALTVRAPDAAAPKLDPGAALQAAFAALPEAQRPDGAAVDPTRFAVMDVNGGAVARALAPCCGRAKGDPVAVQVPVDPAALDPGVGADWRFVGPEGCAVQARGGRIHAERGGSSTAIGPSGAVLLGVTWVPVSHPHRAAAQQRAVETLR